MASKGLTRFRYAKLLSDTSVTSAYDTPADLGGAMTAKLAVKLLEASLSYDDKTQDNITEFASAILNLMVDDDREAVMAALQGQSSSAGTINGHSYTQYTSSGGDEAPEMGFSQIIQKRDYTGATKWKVEFLPRVIFKPYDRDYESKGDKLTLKTPTLVGTVLQNARKEWEKHASFASEADAIAFQDTLFSAGYTITEALTACTSDNTKTVIGVGDTFAAVYTPTTGYTFSTCEVKFGSTTLTVGEDYVWNEDTGTVYVPNVTGNLTVTVTATNS